MERLGDSEAAAKVLATYFEAPLFEAEQIQRMIEAHETSLVAVHRNYIIEHGDGTATVRSLTNDDNDDGIPDGSWEQWTLEFPSVEAALKHTGTCRVGVSGVIVTVMKDGKEIR